jgi:hypothetical protein
MKPVFLAMLFLCATLASTAQLKPHSSCPELAVDILNGTINGLKANASGDEFKGTVACSTGYDSAKCGGAIIFYKDKDVTFYSKRNYFEIGPKFKGKMSMVVLGTPRNALFKYFGNPKVKDTLWDAFETQYGTLVLHYTVAGPGGKVKLIQMSTLGTDELSLCE